MLYDRLRGNGFERIFKFTPQHLTIARNSAENGTFNLNTTGDTNVKGGNITANQVVMNVGGNLNLKTLQDTYEQQGSSFGLNVGAGSGSPAYLNNASISMGATEIFKKITGRRSGVVGLASNDSNLSEEQNLNNLLNSNSVNTTINVDNQTVKKDIDFTNADFEGTLSVPVNLLTKSGRAKMKDAFANFDKNIMTTTAGALNNITDPIAIAINQATNNSEGNTVGDWKQARTESAQGLKLYMENYDKREELTQEGYVYFETHQDEFIIEKRAKYHTYELDEKGRIINILSGEKTGYTKYIHKEKGYEVILDKYDKIVTDPLNKGSYNHFNASGLTNTVNHTLLDVASYIVLGNDGGDPSWFLQRVLRTLYKSKK